MEGTRLQNGTTCTIFEKKHGVFALLASDNVPFSIIIGPHHWSRLVASPPAPTLPAFPKRILPSSHQQFSFFLPTKNLLPQSCRIFAPPSGTIFPLPSRTFSARHHTSSSRIYTSSSEKITPPFSCTAPSSRNITPFPLERSPLPLNFLSSPSRERRNHGSLAASVASRRPSHKASTTLHTRQ